jgi:hypothetical protein
MSLVRRVATLTIIASFGLAATAQAAPRSDDKKDPNKMICEKQEVLGSRLAVKRVCMTRAEWAEQRRIDRQNVERQQVNGGCVKEAGC